MMGLEPTTSAVTGQRSNTLNYIPYLPPLATNPRWALGYLKNLIRFDTHLTSHLQLGYSYALGLIL